MTKNMKFILGNILTLVFAMSTLSCSTFFQRNPAQTKSSKKHYIMTLHGVRGNEQSYGQFHELVKNHLEKIDPSYEVIPLNFTYAVAQTDYTPHKAAAEINAKLDKAIPVLNPEDKISVVAYSMGGQVGVAWYFDSLKEANHSKYPKQTANFISLGAAFWGAEEAGLFTNDIDTLKRTIKGVILEMNSTSQALTKEYLGALTAKGLAATQEKINSSYLFPMIDQMKTVDEVKNFYDNVKIKNYAKVDLGKALDINDTLKNLRNSSLRDLAKISFAELQALSIAGEAVSELRQSMMYTDRSLWSQTKWTSISTLVQCFETDLGSTKPGCTDFQLKAFADLNKSFAKYSFGFKRRETDNAVITPSSVAQFFYASDLNENYADSEMTPATAFKLSIPSDRHQTVFAETLHATVVTEQMYDKVFGYLGKLGKSWSRLADDVVIVHKAKCETPDKCDHPVYKYILDELSGCKLSGNSCDQSQYANLVGKFKKSDKEETTTQETLRSELHGFTIEFNLRVPAGYNLKSINETNIFNFVQADFKVNTLADRILNTDNSKPFQIHLGRRLELGSILIKKVKSIRNQKGQIEDQLKVNLTGLFIPTNNQYNYQNLQQGHVIPITVALPQLKQRRLEVVVAPYHSTYIDLTLNR